MNDYRFKGPAKLQNQGPSTKYQTNLASPNATFMKNMSVHKSVTFQQNASYHPQEESFIPSTP